MDNSWFFARFVLSMRYQVITNLPLQSPQLPFTLYLKFKESKINAALYPHIKEKVASLYSIFKNDDNADRQRLAQWALTYFFDDEDIIHDDVSGLGLVDDMTIIDYATSILRA